ncbi:glycosyltransferase [Paenibacillus sp. HB172176]|uniref:glycosyltransferase family 2 protein n=1 Tax=Paenibacillus sp. HB172176 TaxID=2493690 RepID=UPI00143C6FC0|nr:glycosyltransferase [Paenibacillus sp. HB172176]
MAIWRKHKHETKEILTASREDRRALPNVPDPKKTRSASERRGQRSFEESSETSDAYLQGIRALSLRYIADFEVLISRRSMKKGSAIKAKAVDISTTGILLELNAESNPFSPGSNVTARFNIPSGTMPEGFESAVRIDAKIVRQFARPNEDGEEKQLIALEFEQPLNEYFQKKRWSYSVYTASALLFFSAFFIILLRAESVIYFKYNITLYLYSITAAAFLLSRYGFGALYREVPVDPLYTPGVSIVIPCFNEEMWIKRTILSCMNQDYPIDKLEVIIVDDRSTDRSIEQIEEIITIIHQEAERFQTKERLKLVIMEENGGKREALVKGVQLAKHNLVVFVDSDSFLEPDAIRHLVQPFQDPRMGGVAGRTDVENKYTNAVTKLQTVRYYIAFRIMKAAESWFDCVTCLSGPLSCYRKELIVQHTDAWLNQTFLGQKATFGDDRSMTNFILRTHRTSYQDSAICSTIVPSDMSVFLKQQMRWKRSWLRESLRAGLFIWRKEPFMSLFFYIGILVPIAAPVIVVYNLVYVPLWHHIFPTTFLTGLFMMAALMSLAHLLLRKSRLWVYGLVFCLFYELVLLWQMPVAWVTFWKSTWGTRETPQDVEANNRKKARKQKKFRFLRF